MESGTNLFFEDLLVIFYKIRWKICFIALILSAGIGIYLYFSPDLYRAQAIFKDGGIDDKAQQLSAIKQIIGIESDGNSDALIYFHSQKLLKPLIVKYGLQLQSSHFYLKDFFYPGPVKIKTTISHNHPQIVGLSDGRQATIFPYDKTLKKVRKALNVKQHQKNPKIYYLYFSHPNKQVAKAFLDDLMTSYKAQIKEENHQVSKEQLAFLQKRKNDVVHELFSTLEQHAEYLKDNLGEEGFFDLSDIIEQSTLQQKQFSKSILDLSFEVDALLSDKSDYMENTPVSSDLRSFSKQQNLLKQNKMHLVQAIQAKNTHRREIQEQLNTKKVSLISEIFSIPQKNLFPNKKLSLRDTKLKTDQFIGIDYDTAKQMLCSYQQEIDRNKQTLQKIDYINKQIISDFYSVTSFQTSLEDPFFQSVVAESTKLIKDLEKTNLLSEKEKQIIEEKLSFNKSSLLEQLRHIRNLLLIRQNNLNEHCDHLQSHLLHLIDQEMNYLDKQILQRKNQRIAFAKDQISFLQQMLDKEKKKMVHIPTKWLKENKMNIQSKLDLHLLKALLETVESKNVQNIVSQVLAKPIDTAYVGGKPQSKHVISLSILSFAFFFITLFFVCIVYYIQKGIPLGEANLMQIDFPFIKLSKKAPKVFARRLILQLKKENLFVSFPYRHVLKEVANLLKIEGKSLLVIDLEDKSHHKEDLLFLLEKKKEIKLTSNKLYDQLYLNQHENRFEILKKYNFVQIIQELSTSYDYVFIFACNKVNDLEIEYLSDFIPQLVINANNVTKQQLELYNPQALLVL